MTRAKADPAKDPGWWQWPDEAPEPCPACGPGGCIGYTPPCPTRNMHGRRCTRETGHWQLCRFEEEGGDETGG